MFKIVSCMKSKDSYNRISSQFKKDYIEWEEFIFELEDIKQKIVFTDYDMAIVDEKLWWKTEAIDFFESRGIPVTVFAGDFEEIINALIKSFPDEKSVKKDDDKSSGLESSPDEKPTDDSGIRYIETERIVEKPVEVKVPVYKPVYAGISNQVIVVANLSKRAGSTFVTLNLAKVLSSLKILTCVIEPPIEYPYIFDAIGLEVRIKRNKGEDETFYSYPHVIADNKKILRDQETIDDGIVWLVGDPRKVIINSWDYDKMMKLIYASKKASVYIIDCGHNLENDCIKPLLSFADMVLVVVDPLPAECMQNEKLLNELHKLKKIGLPIDFIFNRWTGSVKKDDLMDYIKIPPLALIPSIETKLIHEAVYNYKIPFELTEIEDALSRPLYQIIKKFVPQELIKSMSAVYEKKKRKLFDFSFLKKGE